MDNTTLRQKVLVAHRSERPATNIEKLVREMAEIAYKRGLLDGLEEAEKYSSIGRIPCGCSFRIQGLKLSYKEKK